MLRAKGLPAAAAAQPQVAFESALALGDVWALDQLWKELGFDALAGVLRKARYTTPIEHAIRVMVFNRLYVPESKLGAAALARDGEHSRCRRAKSHPSAPAAQHGCADGASGRCRRRDHGLLCPLVDQDLSLDNMEALAKIKLPGGQALEFILAVPGRRYGKFAEVLQSFQTKVGTATEEVIDETHWQGLRLVVAHHPERAREQTVLRRERIATLQDKANQWAGKLDGQEAGVKVQTKLMDGKLLLVTNVTALTPTEVVQRYKALADIERGFRVLKSEIEIAPVFHRLKLKFIKQTT